MMTGYTSRYALADFSPDALLSAFRQLYEQPSESEPRLLASNTPETQQDALSEEEQALLESVTEHASGGFAFVGEAAREAGVSSARVGKAEEGEPRSAVRWASEEANRAYAQRYNIKPGTKCVVARLDTSSPREPVLFDTLRWGLIPHWNEKRGRPPSYARDESIASGQGMWSQIRQTKRCLVFGQGFYEWLVKGTERTPYYTKMKGDRLMVMAGLWDRATPPGGETVESFSIVTTKSTKQLEFLSDRMPLILTDPAEMRLWMGGQRWSEALAKIMKPFEGELECYKVSPAVNDPDAESADLIKPYGVRAGNLASLFAKQLASPTQPPHPPKPKLSLAPPALSLTSPLTPSTRDNSSPATSLFGSASKDSATASATKRASSRGQEDASDIEILSSPARPAKRVKRVGAEEKKKGQKDITSFFAKEVEGGLKGKAAIETVELSD